MGSFDQSLSSPSSLSLSLSLYVDNLAAEPEKQSPSHDAILTMKS